MKVFIYKDAYMNGEYCILQESPDICDNMEDAVLTIVDAVKHLCGRTISDNDIDIIKDGGCIRFNCGRGLSYVFYLETLTLVRTNKE